MTGLRRTNNECSVDGVRAKSLAEFVRGQARKFRILCINAIGIQQVQRHSPGTASFSSDSNAFTDKVCYLVDFNIGSQKQPQWLKV